MLHRGIPCAPRARSLSDWRSGAATDTGLLRAHNEDRYWMDDERGIFLVVDGVGGHAAGETGRGDRGGGDPRMTARSASRRRAEQRVRAAIAAANNRIYDTARRSASDLRGMACVLTLALVEDGQITIGHVGDSRLYLIWNGAIRKLTSDHSPVGEDEDAGELTEEEAMLHPRRNEVFRDVGTRPHEAGDDGFIEIRQLPFQAGRRLPAVQRRPDRPLPSARDPRDRGALRRRSARVARNWWRPPTRPAARTISPRCSWPGREFRGRAGGQHAPAHRHYARIRRSRAARRVHRARGFLIYGVLLGILLWRRAHARVQRWSRATPRFGPYEIIAGWARA